MKVKQTHTNTQIQIKQSKQPNKTNTLNTELTRPQTNLSKRHFAMTGANAPCKAWTLKECIHNGQFSQIDLVFDDWNQMYCTKTVNDFLNLFFFACLCVYVCVCVCGKQNLKK